MKRSCTFQTRMFFYRCDILMLIFKKRADKIFFKWSPDNPDRKSFGLIYSNLGLSFRETVPLSDRKIGLELKRIENKKLQVHFHITYRVPTVPFIVSAFDFERLNSTYRGVIWLIRYPGTGRCIDSKVKIIHGSKFPSISF